MESNNSKLPWIAQLASVLLLGVSYPSLSQPLTLDSAYAPALNSNAAVYVVVLQTNGQALIGGSFTSIAGTAITNIARLNSDGSLDSSFNPRAAVNGPGTATNISYVNAIAVQPDGKIVVGGDFSSSSQSAPRYLTRLNANGSVDGNFDNQLDIDSAVNAVVIEPDGQILFAGGFVFVDGLIRRSVARLDPYGVLDITFDACVASTAGQGGTGLVLLPDGKILASGNFTFSTGSYRLGIALLGECGEFDASYANLPNMNDTGVAFALARRPSGKVLLAGNFSSFHYVDVNSLVQLTTTGIPDGSFTSGSGTEYGATVYAVALQEDGKAIIGGEFTQYNSQSAPRLARLNADGTMDVVAPGTGPNNSLSSIAIQADGKILIAGKFDQVNGTTRRGLARVFGDPPRPRLLDPRRLGNGQFQFALEGQPGSNYIVEASSNLLTWTSLTNVTLSNSPATVTDAEASVIFKRWYRARSP